MLEMNEEAVKALRDIPGANLQQLVLQVLQTKGVKCVDRISVSAGSVLGDNYLSFIHRVDVAAAINTGQPRHVNLIIKCAPANKARRETFSTNLLFKNEINFFEQVLPGLQEGTNIQLAVPHYLNSQLNGTDDAIILDDLRPQGFRMRERSAGLDVSHCRLVLRELAKFHALSFVQRRRDSQRFKIIVSHIKDMFFDEDRKTAFEPFLKSSSVETTRVILKHFNNDHDNKYVKYMKKIAEGGFDLIAGIIRGTAERDQVITHGDCWTSNLQFRYDNADNPTDVRLLDFQLLRLTSPATDVMYVLFTSMRHDVMTTHYEQLLDAYHSALHAALVQLGSSAEIMFPRLRLDEEMKRCAPFGIIMAGVVVPAVYCTPQNTPNLEVVTDDKQDAFVQEYAKLMKDETPEGREQLAGVLKHCVDRGFLD